jgi:hypothetical protein
LLIFQDFLFYKLIKNGASIIYNKDGSIDPVSKPLLTSELTVEDKTKEDNINEYYLKHQLFYSYKELEKALRRHYLPHVYFVLDTTQEKHHSAFDIIHIRQTTMEDDICLLDTEGEIIIDKMKSITTFYKAAPVYSEGNVPIYKPGQLVKCRVSNSSQSDSMDSSDVEPDKYFIGQIQTVNNHEKKCDMKLLAKIKDNSNFDENIETLSSQSNTIDLSDPDAELLKNRFSDLFEEIEKETANISFESIYDSSILLGRLIPQPQCAFFNSYKIQYRDIDLFNREFDRDIFTYIKALYEIPNSDNVVLFIKPESVQNIRPEIRPLLKQVDSDVSYEVAIDNLDNSAEIDRKYAYIVFEIHGETKTLISKTCNLIEPCDISKIFENKELRGTYNNGDTHCILIEKVDGFNYIKPGFDDIKQLDTLYFSDNVITINS